jgi:microcystin-dependent protein
MADQPFVGEIRMFGGNFAPSGWAMCNGQLLAISENPTLYQLIGTTFGGDGQSTFALPDLRGRSPLHRGQGPGLSNRTIGATGGTETETLTLNQIPAHSHPPVCSANPGDQTSPVGNVWAPAASGAKLYTNVAPAVALNNTALGSAGGSQPHENRPPYQAVNFIIALFGIFPVQ